MEDNQPLIGVVMHDASKIVTEGSSDSKLENEALEDDVFFQRRFSDAEFKESVGTPVSSKPVFARRSSVESMDGRESTVRSIQGLSTSMTRKIHVWAARAQYFAAIKASRSGKKQESEHHHPQHHHAASIDMGSFMKEHSAPSKPWHPVKKQQQEIPEIDDPEEDHYYVTKSLAKINPDVSKNKGVQWFGRRVHEVSEFISEFQFYLTSLVICCIIGLAVYFGIEDHSSEIKSVYITFGSLTILCLSWPVACVFERLVLRFVDALANTWVRFLTLQYYIGEMGVVFRLGAFGALIFSLCTYYLNVSPSDYPNYKYFWISYVVVAGCWAVVKFLVKGSTLSIFFKKYYASLDKILHKEALLMHLLKPAVQADGSKVGKKFRYKRLKSNSPFHEFQVRCNYVVESGMIANLRKKHVLAPKKNIFSWEYSPESAVLINSDDEIKLFADIIFYNLDCGKYGDVKFIEWLKHFESFKTASKEWRLLFGNVRQSLKGIDMETFEQIVKLTVKDRVNLAADIQDFRGLTSVVEKMLFALFWVIMIFIVALIFQLDAQKTLVTFSTLLIASAVAFGNSMKVLIDSAVFIIYAKPYDVGEKIALDKPDGAPLKIKKIGLLTTVFEGLDNRQLIMQNVTIATKTIYNLTKSKDAIIEVTFDIDINTKSSRLKNLKDRISYYVDHNKGLKNRLDFYVKEVQFSTYKTLHIWIQCSLPWSDGFPINYVRSDLIDFIQSNMSRLGIVYRHPTVPVSFEAGAKIPVAA